MATWAFFVIFFFNPQKNTSFVLKIDIPSPLLFAGVLRTVYP